MLKSTSFANHFHNRTAQYFEQGRGEVSRQVTMVALFQDDNKTNDDDDGDGKENGRKYMFILTNNNFARASHYFVHFFAVVAPLRHETS